MATSNTQQDIIKKFMYYLDNTIYSGNEAVNRAINYATGGYFKDFSAAINQMVVDCKKTKDSDTFLKKYCGIIIDNTDTGAITGKDAGGKTIKTAESIVPESGKLKTSFKATSFTANGLTFRLATTSLTDNEKHIWQALKTWWAAASLNLLKESYGYSFTDSDATIKEITVVFKNEPKKNYMAYTDYPQEINGHYSLVLNINTACFNGFANSDVNGATSNDPCYLDRTIAHELTHAIMMAKVKDFNKLPRFIMEGLAELTHGIDDLRTDAIMRLGMDYKKLQTYVNPSTTINSVYTYSGGYMFFRYLAKQGAANYLSDVNVWEDFGWITIKGTALTVSKDFPENAFDLQKYSAIKSVDASARTKAIKINGNSNANKIVGGSGNDSLAGNAGNDTLSGGKGNDTLSGGTGNDTLTGGTGKDLFIYTAGKDVITDYTADDKISLSSAISKTTLKGSDVVFTIGKGSLTIKNGKGKTLNIIDSTGKKYSTVVGGTTLTLTNSAASPVNVDSSIKVLDASKRTTAINIGGNALANTIQGGSGNDKIYGAAGNDKIYGNDGNDKLVGGNGKDSLYGGAGNDRLEGRAGNDVLVGGAGDDSLWGGTGADTFIYAAGDGNDIIYGFDNKDTLTFDAIDFKASYKNGAITFKVAGGSVTLKDFTATTFHVNNDTYQINSKNKFVKQN